MIDALLGADRWLFMAVNGAFHWGPIDALMMTLSEAKHFYLILGLFLALLIWKGGPTGRAAALLLVLSLVISDQIGSFVIKPMFSRLRPCRELLNIVVLGGCGEGKSFPSSHAFNSFAFVTVLSAFYPRRRRWYYVFAGLIAYSRVHVGAHYPLDVLCGAGFGYGVGLGLVAVWNVARIKARALLIWTADWYHASRRLGEWIRGRAYALPIFSGVLLGVAFPGVRYGLTASIGLIPLLFAIEKMERRHWWTYFKLFYVTFFVFHAIANYWIGGWSAEADPFLMIACVVLMFVHPFFLMVPMVGYAWIRRRLGLTAALVALPFFWTAFEYLHSIGDLGYPWLTLGNTQSYYTEGIQFIEYTGVYGISLLLVAQNALLFYLITAWRERGTATPGPQMALSILALVATVLLPALHSEWVFRENDMHPAPNKKFRVAVIQPNIDPWAKWSTTDVEAQISQLEGVSRSTLPQKPDVFVWPETAVPYYITMPINTHELAALHGFVDSCDVPLLTGVPDLVFYPPKAQHPADARSEGHDRYSASFNSSTLVQPHSSAMPMYHKMQLVPFGERTPFVDEVPAFADLIKWSVGLSGWSKGTDYTIFSAIHHADTARVWGMICYESVYPTLVRTLVARGANLLVIITNDGWYGRTAGPVQHQQYAVLRAIENRRAVARCANTGISCFIDRFGAVDKRTPLFVATAIVDDCALNDEFSWYTAHGDMLAWGCCGIGVLIILSAFVLSRASKIV